MSAKTKEAVVKASRVESIKQSSLVQVMWCCQLDCGHDQWISGKRRPTRKTLVCNKCRAHAHAHAKSTKPKGKR